MCSSTLPSPEMYLDEAMKLQKILIIHWRCVKCNCTALVGCPRVFTWECSALQLHVGFFWSCWFFLQKHHWSQWWWLAWVFGLDFPPTGRSTQRRPSRWWPGPVSLSGCRHKRVASLPPKVLDFKISRESFSSCPLKRDHFLKGI